MRLRRARAILLCSALAAAMAAGCRVQQPPSQHEREQILYQSTISDPRTFNPILVTDSASGEVVGDLFEGLVRINPITTLPEPGLAESWEIGDGGRVIVFHLRHGVKWFDGQSFNASDVVFTMRVIYDPRVRDDDAARVCAAALRDWRSDRACARARAGARGRQVQSYLGHQHGAGKNRWAWPVRDGAVRPGTIRPVQPQSGILDA